MLTLYHLPVCNAPNFRKSGLYRFASTNTTCNSREAFWYNFSMRVRWSCLFALLLSEVGFGSVNETLHAVTGDHVISRPNGPASLSGVTWVSNSTYLAATDWNPTLWELTLPLDGTTGKPLSCKVREHHKFSGSTDVEDIAVDPLDKSKLWIADELSATIRKIDARSGKELARLRMPVPLAKTRTDMGLESLTLSRDGLQLWTTSEEAVEADGPISNNKRGTDVRLTRFRRKAADTDWQLDGQWIYRTDPKAGGSWKTGESGVDASRSGVSGLCLLDDGTLLALEREFSVVILPRFRCRIYEVDFDHATEVSSRASITNSPISRTGKCLLYETTGFAMYEGICEGPRLKDGARSLILVSDGDHHTAESILSLKLERKRKRTSD